MRPATARRILSSHVDDPNGDIPPRIQSALKSIGKSLELQSEYENQCRIDASLQSAFREIEVPEDAMTAFSSKVAAIAPRNFNLRDPAIIAVVIGLVLLVLVLAWDFLGRPASFPPDGLEIAESLLNVENSAFHPLSIPTAELEDWFVLKGFDGFRIPTGLENLKVDSAGVLEIEKQQLAVVGLPSIKAQLAVFNAAPWNIVMPDGEWRTTQVDSDYAVAIRREKGVCFLLLREGSETALNKLLNAGSP